MKRRIAIVDDDDNIRTSVMMAFEEAGFHITEYDNGADALEDLMETPFDLIILDIKMPRMDGVTVLKKIREKITTPVIFLTSKDDEMDELVGLRVGADDYITKPFSMRLLIERVYAIIRRYDIQKGDIQNSGNAILEVGFLTMDDDTYTCNWKGKTVDITVTEYMILRSLVDFPGQVKNREQMLRDINDKNFDISDRAIDSHVRRIRLKFKDIDKSFSNIESVYGLGYRFNVDV